MKRDTAIKLLYENLNGFNVQIPTNYINSGGSDGGTAGDVHMYV